MSDEVIGGGGFGLECVKRKEEVAMTLARNTMFLWECPQQDWVGMNRRDLMILTTTVGMLLGIRQNEAERMGVIFGDHITVPSPGGCQTRIAFCKMNFSDDNRVDWCGVVLNRSYELASHFLHGEEAKGKSENIRCVFEEPYEVIVWFLSEELKHAQIWCVADNVETEQKWQRRYEEIIKKKGRIFDEGSYDRDVQEITVSRVALRVLKSLVPKRADYYQKLYDRSLREGRRVAPCMGKKVMAETFIMTGFDPKILT